VRDGCAEQRRNGGRNSRGSRIALYPTKFGDSAASMAVHGGILARAGANLMLPKTQRPSALSRKL